MTTGNAPTIEFKRFRRKQIAELADWYEGFDMTGVSVSDADKQAGSPKIGDKIARNPKNHADRWLVAAAYFADNFEPVEKLAALEKPVPVEPYGFAHIRQCYNDDRKIALSHFERDAIEYIDLLQSALKLAQEEHDRVQKILAKEIANHLMRAEKAESELAALQLIGEVKEGGVVWANQNPHAYPIGTKFYCIQE